MAKLSDAANLDIVNKLSLGVASSNTDKNYFEESYPWLPTVTADDIWAETVPTADTPTEADTNASDPAGIVEKLTSYVMDEIPLSVGQGWSIYDTPGDTSSTRLIDWLNPAQFGAGYSALLYENDNTSIALTDGKFQIDYKNGIVRFDESYTPSDLGYATPLKITLYRYSGTKGVTSGSGTSFTPHQHFLTPQNIAETDGDTTLNDELDYAVNNPESVILVLNKLIQTQGSDYTLSGTTNQQIVWLRGTGNAVDMYDSDELYAIYLS